MDNRHLEDAAVTVTHPSRKKPDAELNENAHETRIPRTVRFSDSEWKRIKFAATERGISIGGFIRDAALQRAARHSGNTSASFPPEIRELINHTFRYAFILAAIKRDELEAGGRNHSMDKAVDLARKAQAELEAGAGAAPGVF